MMHPLPTYDDEGDRAPHQEVDAVAQQQQHGAQRRRRRRRRTVLALCLAVGWVSACTYLDRASHFRRRPVTERIDPYPTGKRALDRRRDADAVALPPPYDLLSDVSDYPFSTDPRTGGGDVPYFWHVHKSGGSSMKHLLTCMGKIQTRRVNDGGCSDADATLKVCQREFGRIVNVDASSFEGIRRAVELKLTSYALDDLVITSSRVYDALDIFAPGLPRRRGRLFALFRHPVERAISKYHYNRVATWERNYKPQISNMTLMEFAHSKYCYRNWITRRLVNKMTGDLTRDDLDLAMEILRRKVLVLLMDDMAGATERVRSYFGWNRGDDHDENLTDEQRACVGQIADGGPVNSNPHPLPPYGGEEWNAIRAQNEMDLELYALAKDLYRDQGEMIARYRDAAAGNPSSTTAR